MLRSLLAKLRLRWYEGVFIGVLGIVVIIAFGLSTRLSDTQEQLAVSELAIEQAKRLHRTQQQRQVIDESVVSTINETLLHERRRQQTIREELIRDYLIFPNQDPPTSHPTTDPVDEVVDTSSSRVSEAPTPPTTTVVDDGGDDRVTHLTRGMFDTYCNAADTATDCPSRRIN